MRTGLIVAIIAVVAIIGAFALGLIDVDQTKETKLPEIAVEGGQAPAFDVKTADVVVGTKETEIEVPKVEVDTTTEKVDVPVVGVKKAE